MATFEYILLARLVPTVFLLWLAWTVARSPYQAAGNRLLSAFLALVGSGFLLEFLADFTQPLAPPLAVLLRGLALTVGVADPLVLLAFSLAFPDPRPALRSRALWGVACAAAVLTLYAVLTAGSAGAWTMTVYVDATYLACFAILLHAHARERHRFRERQLFFVTLGAGFAAVSRSAAVFIAHPLPAVLDPALVFLLSGLGMTLLLTGLLYAWARLQHAPDGRAGRLFAWLLSILLGFSAVHYLLFTMDVLGYHLAGQYFGLRWVVVGGILGYGILCYQILDLELRIRQAVIFLASLFAGTVAAFATALSLAEGGGTGLTTSRAAGVAAGAVATLLVHALLTWGWRRLQSGAELPARFHRRRMELYEAALEYALADAPRTLGDHLFAVTLREVFEISPTEHEQVMRQLTVQAGPPS